MTLVWCGGEDVDFPNGTAPTIGTAGGQFRAGYARCGLRCGSGGSSTRGPSFIGGAITSGWLHYQAFVTTLANATASPFAGLGLNAAGNGGIFVGCSAASVLQTALFKWDGTTLTQLAAEVGTSLVATGLQAIDLEITNLGASSTVIVYVNNTQVITFSGSTVISGITSLDCVSLYGIGNIQYMSEHIVETVDSRSMSLFSMAPASAGDSVGAWSNTFASINPVTINDANAIFTNTAGSDFQADLTALPAGSFQVLGCKAVARAAVTAGAATTGVKLGIKSGGTINVDAGHTPGTAFTNYERLMVTNPVTSTAWTTVDLAALQLDLQSE